MNGRGPQHGDLYPLGAIVGPARSGTTWAGALLDSSPDVIYRFEPFHRLRKIDGEVQDWMERLKAQAVRERDLPALYSLLLPAHPLTDKAPFFEHKNYPVRTFGRRQLWPLARVMAPIRPLYSAVYTPRSRARIIFKEVTFVRPMKNLVEQTSLPVVYLVRHPCATVLSALRAPDGSSIASTHVRLSRTLRNDAPAFADLHADVIDGTDVVRQHALMWLYEVESCVAAARASSTAIVMTYEQLAVDAYLSGERLFRHLGIEFGESTKRFIDGLYSIRTPRRTGWGAAYFSVYRNPRDSMDSWKSKISSDERRKVESVVQGHPQVEYCARLGGWW